MWSTFPFDEGSREEKRRGGEASGRNGGDGGFRSGACGFVLALLLEAGRGKRGKGKREMWGWSGGEFAGRGREGGFGRNEERGREKERLEERRSGSWRQGLGNVVSGNGSCIVVEI